MSVRVGPNGFFLRFVPVRAGFTFVPCGLVSFLSGLAGQNRTKPVQTGRVGLVFIGRAGPDILARSAPAVTDTAGPARPPRRDWVLEGSLAVFLFAATWL